MLVWLILLILRITGSITCVRDLFTWVYTLEELPFTVPSEGLLKSQHWQNLTPEKISGRTQRLAGSGHQSMWWPNSIVLNLALESHCSRSAPPRLQTVFRSAATEESVIHFHVSQINNINRYWNSVCTLYVLPTLRASLSGTFLQIPSIAFRHLKVWDVVNQCLEFAFYPDTSHFVPQEP